MRICEEIDLNDLRKNMLWILRKSIVEEPAFEMLSICAMLFRDRNFHHILQGIRPPHGNRVL